MMNDSTCIRIDARLWNSVAGDGIEINSIKQAVMAILVLENNKFLIIICILNYQ